MREPLVRLGSTLAVLGAVHAAVNARLLRDLPVATANPAQRVSVLLPVRDEAHQVADALAGVLAQPGPLDVVVLDDGSTDGTAAAVRAVDDPRVRLLTGAPPPAGVPGKPHACRQLAAAADPASAVLVFLDADVRLAPGAIAATMEVMGCHGYDLVSPYPRLVADGPAERLVQPLLPWSWLTFLPLRLAERSTRPSLLAAGGQFLAVRAETYARAGGHPDHVLDDLGLARAVRASGGRVGLVDGSRLASCRMYANWRGLRDGYGKSLWAAFGSPAGAVATTGLLGLTYLLPPLAALRGSRVGLLGYTAGVAGRVVAARRTRGRVWPDALAHPNAARSLWLRRRGRLVWKGRPV